MLQEIPNYLLPLVSGVLPMAMEDIQIPASAMMVGGDDAPSLGVVASGVSYYFDPATLNAIYFDVFAPHARKNGSDLFPRIHWTPYGTMGIGATVVWKLAYSIAEEGADFQDEQILTVTHTATGTEKEHIVSAFPAIPGSGIGNSALIKCKLYRDAATDTYSDYAMLSGVTVHHYKDRIGGRP